MQAAAVQPPPPAAGQTAPPPLDAGTVFTTAVRDENGGKLDQAISEYQDFIKFFPDNPNAARAQYNIGNSHYTQQKFDTAAQDFDLVITKYPEDTTLTPQAYFMKGMSLKNTNKTSAIQTWRQLIAKYPHSDSAAQAKEQLRALGVPLTTPTASSARKKAGH
jgi:TolA-binding protein